MHVADETDDVRTHRDADGSDDPTWMQRRLYGVLDAIPDAVVVLDRHGRNAFANASMTRLAGYAPHERRGRVGLDLVHPENLAEVTALLATVMSPDGRPVNCRARLRHKSGQWIPVELSASNRLENPDVMGIVVAIRDRTDDLARESRMVRSEIVAKFLADNSGDVLIYADSGRRMHYLTPSSLAVLGVDHQELRGSELVELFHDRDRATVEAAVAEAVDGRYCARFEARARARRTDDTVWLDVSIRRVETVRDDRGFGLHVTLRDATVRHLAQARIAQLVEILEASRDFIATTDLEGNVLWANGAARTLFGADSLESLLETAPSLFSYFTPSSREAFIRDVVPQLWREGSWTGEIEAQRRDGTALALSQAAIAHLGSNGKPRFFSGIARDISAMKAAEVALRTSEERCRALLSQSVDILLVLDAQLNITFAAPAVERVLGFKSEQLVGTAALSLLHPDDVPKAAESLLPVMSGTNSGKGVQYRVQHRDGSWRWIESIASNHMTTPGVEGIIVSARDVTDRLAAEREHVRVLMNLRMLLKSIDEGIYAVDAEGRCSFMNRAACDLLGFAPDDVVGMNAHDLLHRDGDREAHAFADCPVVRSMRDGETLRVEDESFRAHDGRVVPVVYTSAPLVDGDVILGAVVAFSDVTAGRRSAEAQRSALRREQDMVVKLQELDRAKSDFVSTVSHELRTPLTSIVGFTELLVDDLGETVPEAGRHMLAMVERNARRLLLLVEDLLSISRIEAGTFQSAREQVALGPVVLAAIEAIRPLAESKRLRVAVEVPNGLSPVVGDPTQLEQVMLNLLNNATKFTPAGGTVEVLVAQFHDMISVSVTDSGIGIADLEQGDVFRRFFRSTNAQALAIPGTGLGLAIVKSIVDAHGGRVELQSEPGVGTTVSFHVPVVRVVEPPRGASQ